MRIGIRIEEIGVFRNKAARDDAVLSARVRVAQLPVRFVCLARWNQLKDDASMRGIRWPFGDAREEALAGFMDVVNANDVWLTDGSRGMIQVANE